MVEKRDKHGLMDESERYYLIQENEKHFRQIVRHMPVMFWVFDDQGKLVFWNRESERITGFAEQAVVGSAEGLKKLWPEGEEPDWVGTDAPQSLEPAGQTARGEMDILCRDGSRKTISWSRVRRTFQVSGWHSWIIAVDVTEHRKAEKINRANIPSTLV